MLWMGAATPTSAIITTTNNDDNYLKYAYYDGDWHSQTVDETTDVGGHISLALDGSGNPHISYFDYTYDDLKYAWCEVQCGNTSNWHTQTVDATGDVGGYNSLALDGSGNPHISYFDETNDDLKYAYYDGDWHMQTVDASGDVGQYNFLALDGSGNPHISYFDYTYDDLKYTWCEVQCGNTSNWHTQTVDATGYVGQYTSLALDGSDNPHISYYDATNGDLKYAYYDGGWHAQTVAVTGIIGYYTSLDLCGSGNAHISYFDGDLRYAFWEEDTDGDFIPNSSDNCPNIFNPGQEDTDPLGGNGVGDACDCEGDFACDGDVDGSDASTFKADFGRSVMVHPCIVGDNCNGDFSCDGDVDGTDASLFKQDFGRSSMQNPCPACVAGEWCGY